MASIYNNLNKFIKNKVPDKISEDSKLPSSMIVVCIVSIIIVFIIFNLLNTYLFKIIIGVFAGLFICTYINKK